MIPLLGLIAWSAICAAVGYTACWQSNKAEILQLRDDAQISDEAMEGWRTVALDHERRLTGLYLGIADALERSQAEEASSC